LGQTGLNNKGYLQVLTKDSVTVSVDAVVYYRVSNATISVANVENAHHSTRYREYAAVKFSFSFSRK
jgi:regulator of protease activity HflC (stomatin/prohibitin superfamily)